MIEPQDIQIRGPMAQRLFDVLQADFSEIELPESVRRAIELASTHGKSRQAPREDQRSR